MKRRSASCLEVCEVTQPVLINVVLDKSGSMHNLQRATIEGFNSLLHDQLKQPGECRVSLTQFDTTFQVDYVGEDIHYVNPLDIMSYRPGGGTALLDAVGTTIKGAEQWIVNNNTLMPWYPPGQHPKNRGWKVIVAIFTDGEENSSHEWHLNQPMKSGDDRDVGGLIQWKQNEGWEFLFLGAGGSAWLERTFGRYVAHDHFVGYVSSPEAHTHTYAGLSASVSSTRTTGNFDTSHLHNTGKTPEENTGTTP
jgi:hypothetical protein